MNSARSVASPSRPWTRAGAWVLGLGLGLALGGCGQKGALYLPTAPAARAMTPAAVPIAPATAASVMSPGAVAAPASSPAAPSVR